MLLSMNRHTTIHLFPSSSSNLGGFLARTVGFLPTAGGAFFWSTETVEEVLNSGFLCVIWDGSTFLSPEVTDPPLLSAASRAAAPPAPAAAAAGLADWSTGGGGGGGGAPPPVEVEEDGTEDGAGSPCRSAHVDS